MHNNPLIIVGMHRSGTTMLSRIADQLGIFCGAPRNLGINHEPRYFIKLNNWILRQAGASWDNPLFIENLYSNDNKIVFDLIVDRIRASFFSPNSWPFWGANFFKRQKLVWGWKEPRTTLTFPVWARIFPDAKFIYVVRNSVDVANSLVTRKQKIDMRFAERNIQTWRTYKLDGSLKDIDFAQTLRCTNLKESFNLALEYSKVWENHKSLIPSENILFLKYEELLQNTGENLTRVCNFMELKINDNLNNKISKSIIPENAYRYKTKPELRTFIETNRDLIKKDPYYDY